MFVKIVQNARGGLWNDTCFDDEEVRTLPAEEAASFSAGGAASDTAHYAASPRPSRHASLLRLSL